MKQVFLSESLNHLFKPIF